MINKINLAKNFLKNQNYDAWIIYDYECTNDALISFLGKRFLTRKIFLVIPKDKKPFIIAHTIDLAHLSDDTVKPYFDLVTYRTWADLMNVLRENISCFQRVLMEISDSGALPKSSYCDYGTVNLIKSLGVEVYSSADLLMSYTSTYSGEALESQYRAMKIVAGAKDKAFKFIEEKLKKNECVTEYDVMKFITDEFDRNNLEYDSNPIVAVNKNAGNPHYEPSETEHSEIKKGDLILIDLWAREKLPEGVYADITWMGYAGKNPPQKYVDLFNILKESVDAGLDFINQNINKRMICGYEVDDAVRNVLKKYNQDKFLIHRVGHSICIDITPHGKGVNIDNYETHDTRHILNNVGFSIEPGIYTDEYGLREEIDVYIDNNKAISVAPRQDSLILLDVD